MIEFRQGFRSMAAPTRELEKLIVSKKLAHGGNPVTRWMAANVAVAQDPAGNLKPAKDKSTDASMASSPPSWPSAAPWSPRKSRSPSTRCSLSDPLNPSRVAVAQAPSAASSRFRLRYAPAPCRGQSAWCDGPDVSGRGASPVCLLGGCCRSAWLASSSQFDCARCYTIGQLPVGFVPGTSSGSNPILTAAGASSGGSTPACGSCPP